MDVANALDCQELTEQWFVIACLRVSPDAAPGCRLLMEAVILIFTKILSSKPGGRLNKKDGLTRYGNSHVKDKTS